MSQPASRPNKLAACSQRSPVVARQFVWSLALWRQLLLYAIWLYLKVRAGKVKFLLAESLTLGGANVSRTRHAFSVEAREVLVSLFEFDTCCANGWWAAFAQILAPLIITCARITAISEAYSREIAPPILARPIKFGSHNKLHEFILITYTWQVGAFS